MPRLSQFDPRPLADGLDHRVSGNSLDIRSLDIRSLDIRRGCSLACGLLVMIWLSPCGAQDAWSIRTPQTGQTGEGRSEPQETSQLDSLLQRNGQVAPLVPQHSPGPQASLRPAGSLVPPDRTASHAPSRVPPPVSAPVFGPSFQENPGDPAHSLGQARTPAGGQLLNPSGTHSLGPALAGLRTDATPVPATPVGRPQQSGRKLDPLNQPLPGPTRNARGSDSSVGGAGAGGAGTGLGGTGLGGAGLGSGASQLFQTGLALALVLVLLFISVWFLKRATPRSLQPLPIETVQVLGNAPLHGKQHLRLIRLGQRLLLLAVSETSSQTLAEVTDPAEVQQLLELCQAKSPQSVSQAFESLLQEGVRERTTGFLGSQQDQISVPRPAATGFAEETDTERLKSPRPLARPASHHFFEA